MRRGVGTRVQGCAIELVSVVHAVCACSLCVVCVVCACTVWCVVCGVMCNLCVNCDDCACKIADRVFLSFHSMSPKYSITQHVRDRINARMVTGDR